MADKKLIFDMELPVDVELLNDVCQVDCDLKVELLAQGVLRVDPDDEDAQDLGDHYQDGTLTFEIQKVTLDNDLTVEALGQHHTLVSDGTVVTDQLTSSDREAIFDCAVEFLEMEADM